MDAVVIDQSIWINPVHRGHEEHGFDRGAVMALLKPLNGYMGSRGLCTKVKRVKVHPKCWMDSHACLHVLGIEVLLGPVDDVVHPL